MAKASLTQYLSPLQSDNQPLTIDWTSDKACDLTVFQNQWIVLYFYPKDNTPGCTHQAQDFNQHLPQFEQLGTQVIGVSKDSLRKHHNFVRKYQLGFPLISDPDEHLCRAFDVIQLKKHFGRTYEGIVRSTFLFSDQGTLCHLWQPVKVKGHAQTVLDTLKTYQSSQSTDASSIVDTL